MCHMSQQCELRLLLLTLSKPCPLKTASVPYKPKISSNTPFFSGTRIIHQPQKHHHASPAARCPSSSRTHAPNHTQSKSSTAASAAQAAERGKAAEQVHCGRRRVMGGGEADRQGQRGVGGSEKKISYLHDGVTN